METPSSLMRVTRSQTSVKSRKNKKEASVSRSPLLDITNDSPIVGVAMVGLSEKTPNSSVVKSRGRDVKNTPGSGEALLRGQVRSLLQKVEEEAEFVNNKIALEERPPFRVVLGLPGPSPIQMVAPTPANTPQIVIEESFVKNGSIKIVEAVKPEESQDECVINRALLFDSPDKSEITDNTSSISSSLSFQGSEIRSYPQKSPEDDSSSAWSIQVNVSLKDEDEEEEIDNFDEEEEDDDDEYDDVEEYYDESFDDLCEGLSKMTMHEEKIELPDFEGKHTRFVYNSADEIEGEELIVCGKVVSPSAVVLKGLPVPEGKHLRFHEEEEEED